MKFGLGWSAALILIGCAWGLSIPLTKLAVSTGHQPLGLIFWQLLTAVVTLGLIALWRRTSIPISKETLAFCAVIAVLGTIIPNSFSYLAASKLPAGIMAIIISMVPVLALPISIALKLETGSLLRLTGVLLGATAIILLMAPVTELPGTASALFLLIALIAPLCYAFEENFVALRGSAGLDPMQVILGASIIGTAISAPLALGSGQWVNVLAPWSIAEWALLGASLLHCFAYTSFIWLISRTGPVFSSMVAYVVTASGVFWSMLLLNESYSGPIWTAFFLMIAAMTLVRPRAAKKTVSPDHNT